MQQNRDLQKKCQPDRMCVTWLLNEAAHTLGLHLLWFTLCLAIPLPPSAIPYCLFAIHNTDIHFLDMSVPSHYRKVPKKSCTGIIFNNCILQSLYVFMIVAGKGNGRMKWGMFCGISTIWHYIGKVTHLSISSFSLITFNSPSNAPLTNATLSHHLWMVHLAIGNSAMRHL